MRRKHLNQFQKGAFIYDVRWFWCIFDLPTYPHQMLYYISLFSKIRWSLTYLPTQKSEVIYECSLMQFWSFALKNFLKRCYVFVIVCWSGYMLPAKIYRGCKTFWQPKLCLGRRPRRPLYFMAQKKAFHSVRWVGWFLLLKVKIDSIN